MTSGLITDVSGMSIILDNLEKGTTYDLNIVKAYLNKRTCEVHSGSSTPILTMTKTTSTTGTTLNENVCIPKEVATVQYVRGSSGTSILGAGPSNYGAMIITKKGTSQPVACC